MNMTRKEAIGRIQEHIHIHSKKEPFTPYLDKAFDMAIEALKEQRPHGEWIEHRRYNWGYYSEYECSSCHDEVWQKTEWQFCPNCGSDNRKEGEKE